MKRQAFFLKAEVALAILLLGSACLPIDHLPTTIQLTVFPTPTASPSGTPSLTPSATATPTATKTSTFIPTRTWTPSPTLPPAEARQLVQTLLTTNGGCMLPCWWDLTPGQTRGAEVEAYLKTFALSLDDYNLKEHPLRLYGAYFPITTSTRWQDNLGADFYVTTNDDILDLSVVGPGKPVAEILANYGPPTEVWLSSSGVIPPLGRPNYELSLVYPQYGILAFYAGFGQRESRSQGDILSICPYHLRQGNSGFFLWSPTRPRSFGEILGLRRQNLTDRRIEEVSNMSVAQFSEAFLHPTSPPTCLETPIDLLDTQ